MIASPAASDVPQGGRVPSVGVVLPNYSRVEELAHALESIDQQDYAGQVRTYLVYEPRPELDPLLNRLGPEVVAVPSARDPAKGDIAVRRNVGLAASTEDYIAVLDDDDLWHPSKLTLQVGTLLAHPSAVACCTGQRRFRLPDLPDWSGDLVSTEPRPVSHREVLSSTGTIATSSVLMRGDVARQLRFDERPEWQGVEDYAFWLQLSTRGAILLLQAPLTAFGVDSGSTSRARTDRQYARALNVLIDWIDHHALDADSLTALARRTVFTALHDHPGGHDPAALKTLDLTFNGRLPRMLDAAIPRLIKAAWDSHHIVPAIRATYHSKAVTGLRHGIGKALHRTGNGP